MEWKILEPGDIFEERYRIKSVLGVGGFAHVYRAIQDGIDREVAIKVLRPLQGNASTSDEQAMELELWIKRFKREAKVISNLRDPHTITMYDFGLTDSGMSYMVFEFISGDSLDEVIRNNAPLSPDRVVSILRQCLSSIQEAHAMGILHRDLKPANIMVYDHLGRQDQVKVLDFGIAKSMFEEKGATTADLTQEGKIIGTPRYMSPEQLMVEDLGPGSDVYSLGLVTFELVYGKKAISGNSTMKIISKQVTPDPIELPDDAQVPSGLRKILQRMLVKKQSDRFATADEVLEALDYWEDEEELTLLLEGEPKTIQLDSITAIVEDSDMSSPATNGVAGVADESSEQAGSNASGGGGNGLVLGALVGMVVILGALVFLLLSGGDDVEQDEAHQADESTLQAQQIAEESATEEEAPVAESEAASVMVDVVTEPSGAEVLVAGSVVGTSPMEFDAEDASFPLLVTARLDDGREAEEEIDAGQHRVELVFEEEAADEPPPPEEEETPQVEAQPRAEPTPRPEPRARVEPEPGREETTREEAQEEPEKEEEDSGQDSFDNFIPLD